MKDWIKTHFAVQIVGMIALVFVNLTALVIGVKFSYEIYWQLPLIVLASILLLSLVIIPLLNWLFD